jgi:hypothetical protein
MGLAVFVLGTTFEALDLDLQRCSDEAAYKPLEQQLTNGCDQSGRTKARKAPESHLIDR